MVELCCGESRAFQGFHPTWQRCGERREKREQQRRVSNFSPVRVCSGAQLPVLSAVSPSHSSLVDHVVSVCWVGLRTRPSHPALCWGGPEACAPRRWWRGGISSRSPSFGCLSEAGRRPAYLKGDPKLKTSNERGDGCALMNDQVYCTFGVR